MTPLNLLTPFMWKTMGVVLLAIALVFGFNHWKNGLIEDARNAGKAEVQALWDADKDAQKIAENNAILDRLAHNLAVGERNLAINSEIQRNNDEELRQVHARLYSAERMRKPAKLCGKAPAAGTEAAGTGSSDAADPEAGLLQRTVEANIRGLIWETEQVAAAARSCQAFVRKHGFYTDPPRTETPEPKDPNPDADGGDHASDQTEAEPETDAESNQSG